MASIEGFMSTLESMPLSQFIELIKDNVAIKKKGIDSGNPNVRVMNLWAVSLPGIGKTKMIQDVAKKIGAEYRYIPGSNVFQGDLSGVPVVVQPDGSKKLEGPMTPEVRKVMINQFFPPIPKTEKEMKDPNHPYNKAGFLFVDELMNMDPLVRGELLAYIDGNSKSPDGEIIDNFPPSWFLVAASNTEAMVGDNYVDLAPNVRAKFAAYYVYPDFDDYLKYMQTYEEKAFKAKGFHPVIMSYLMEHKDHLAPVFDSVKDSNVASPRNWEAMNSYLRLTDEQIESGFSDIVATKNKFEFKARAVLGKEVGEKFLEYYQFEKETIDPKTFLTKDLSKETKWKDFNKKGLQLRLMSMYRALDYLATVDEKEKDKSFKDMLKTIQDNVVWLISDRGEEHVVGFLDSMVGRLGNQFTIKDLTKQFKDIAEKSTLFNLTRS